MTASGQRASAGDGGCIDDDQGLTVNDSLLSVILHD